MSLPVHPDPLCFSTDDFLKSDFNVDEFVVHCRKSVTAECLRDDLEAYFRTLKSAMVDLINNDYADFLNLSSNLVGMDKAIHNLTSPLLELKTEITDVKTSLETTINALEAKLSLCKEIRAKKSALHCYVVIVETVEILERLLKIGDRPRDPGASQLIENERLTDVVMDRVTSEFSRLKYMVSKAPPHHIVENIKPRIAQITAALQRCLDDSFVTSLESNDREQLSHCLRAYATIGHQAAAESLFQSHMVHPYMQKVVSVKALNTQGLAGMYADVLKFFSQYCVVLSDVVTGRGGAGGGAVGGFDFVSNAVWPEIVATLLEKVSVIYSPGNPDSFCKHYTVSMDFIERLEEFCSSEQSVQNLRNHPSFAAFISKWNIAVYFQIRFQEIAGLMENSLQLPLQPAELSKETEAPLFNLELFNVLWRCMAACWKQGIFIPALVHKFWKLTLQLLMRVSQWFEEVCTLSRTIQSDDPSKGLRTDDPSKGPPKSDDPSKGPRNDDQGPRSDDPSKGSRVEGSSLSINDCLKVMENSEQVAQQIPSFFEITVRPHLSSCTVNNPHLLDKLQEGLEEAGNRFKAIASLYGSTVVAVFSQQCVQNLEPTHTIPRLYRRTNREVPTKPSSYVTTILKPLLGIQVGLSEGYRKDWSCKVIDTTTQRYLEIITEVLTSVKKTEDSLQKLKRTRKSVVPEESTGLSDDNKIRLQIAFDVEQYYSDITSLHPDTAMLSSVVQLQEMGQIAKTTAQTTLS